MHPFPNPKDKLEAARANLIVVQNLLHETKGLFVHIKEYMYESFYSTLDVFNKP
jgi:hypothetical protein